MSTAKQIPWLPTKRTCDCPKGALNCLSEREWLRNQVPIWYFSANKLNTKFDVISRQHHPAVFPSVLAKRVIKNYSHENETVLDVFSGVGTTLYAAQLLHRCAIGFDLNNEFSEFTSRRLGLKNDDHYPIDESTHRKTKPGQHLQLFNSNSKRLSEYIPRLSIDLAFTSPPYWDLLNQPPSKRNIKNQKYLKNNYSKDPEDISNEKTLNCFMKKIQDIFSQVYSVLKPGAHCIINTGDYRRKGKYISLSSNYINIMKTLDFELKNVIILDRRNEYKIGIFSYPVNFIVNNGMFEYLLEFQK